MVILDPRGVINSSVVDDEDSENVNDSSTALDVEFESNSVQENLSDEEEKTLAEQIQEHWNEHQKKKVSVAKSRAQLKLLRSCLASELFRYKKHLVRVGRNGGWAPFLRERDIPLSTADRYVKQCELSLMRSSGKLLSEEDNRGLVSVPWRRRFIAETAKPFPRLLRAALTLRP
jgi:hypothetical protein